MTILSLLIALLFCTLPSSVAQTLGGCLSGFYKFSSKKSNAETPIADADPPVKALDFSFTPEGDCSVAFILLDDANILKLRSVGEVPSEYAAEFDKLASLEHAAVAHFRSQTAEVGCDVLERRISCHLTIPYVRSLLQLIILVFCILPSRAQRVGCLSGFYPYSYKEAIPGTPLASADPPVKALHFDVTPEGDCSVAFILYAGGTTIESFSALYDLDDLDNFLNLRSVGEVPAAYAAKFNELAYETTLSMLTEFDGVQYKAATIFWEGGSLVTTDKLYILQK
ncbi:hypothetical protein FOZ60_010129 [Perkinsus olseni]|uniref:Uncharacterized protein n=1 Tax=Perkinsus olseni TaxID=32597 RepID=A0A7J6PED1_PEROL|nr:hypothetical protein FOZ60_010129 [Perkinsus olseni]